MLHVHALASTCAQNDLDSANLHNMSTNPKKVLPTSDEQFTRSFPDKKVPGRRKTSANCNGDRYRCSPNAPQLPFIVIFPVSVIK